jgi:hypothetical protein
MNVYRNTRRYVPAFALAVLILVSLACGETSPTSEPNLTMAHYSAQRLKPRAKPAFAG